MSAFKGCTPGAAWRRFLLLPAALLALAWAGVVHAAPSYCIISDLDDTVRISDAQSRSGTFVNLLFHRYVFAGSAQLFRGSLRANPGPASGGHRLFFVSGSPPILRGQITQMLEREGFPPFDLTLRPLPHRERIDQFKVRAISDIIERSGCDRFVLYGDDTELDRVILNEIRLRYPQRVLEIYIRSVKGAGGLADQRSFYTALEPALHEWRNGRFGDRELRELGWTIVREARNRPYLVVPGFMKSPSPNWLSQGIEPGDEVEDEETGVSVAAVIATVEETIREAVLRPTASLLASCIGAFRRPAPSQAPPVPALPAARDPREHEGPDPLSSSDSGPEPAPGSRDPYLL